MKDKITQLIQQAINRAHKNGQLPSEIIPDVEVAEPKADAHGDFSTNIAMVMASAQKMAPRKIAEAIVSQLDDADGILERTEIAGPGFINFFLNPSAWHTVLRQIHRTDTRYGFTNVGNGQKMQESTP